MYSRLPVARQRDIYRQIAAEAKDADKVIPFDEVLTQPEVLKELESLARAAKLPVAEMALVLNPFRYSSYFARSRLCTIARFASVDRSRYGDAAESLVFVDARSEIVFRHSLIPEEFDLYVRSGHLDVQRGTAVTKCPPSSIVTIAPGNEATLHVNAGCWFVYSQHPLTAWISIHGRRS